MSRLSGETKSFTWDVNTLTGGQTHIFHEDGSSNYIPWPGAEKGDFVFASHASNNKGIIFTGSVRTTDQVYVFAFNPATDGTNSQNVDSGTLTVKLVKQEDI